MPSLNAILTGIGAAVALIVAVTIIWLSLSNAHLKAELASADSTMTACRFANDAFKASVEKQNAALAQLATESESRARRVAAAETTIREITAESQRKVAALNARQTRGDICAATNALMDEYVRGHR